MLFFFLKELSPQTSRGGSSTLALIHPANFECLDQTVDQGPVVQSLVSLTSSLRGQLVKCFTTS